jgi:hypothetical protein
MVPVLQTILNVPNLNQFLKGYSPYPNQVPLYAKDVAPIVEYLQSAAIDINAINNAVASVLPANALGFLHNDGAGNLIWDNVAGTGTVTTVSVVSANGFAGSVANPTTTPATGNTVVATAQIAQLVCNPAGTLVALTVTFPPSPVNGQQFDLAISQIITTLTLNTSDGSSIDGTITTSAVNSFGGWVYCSTPNVWFKNR